MTLFEQPPAVDQRRCITCHDPGMAPGRLRHDECKPPTTVNCLACGETVQIREFADHHLHRGGESECEQIQALRAGAA